MQPGELYMLAVVVTALFVAPFNGMARVVVLAWLVTHVFYSTGLPEVWANILGQAAILLIGWRHMRCAPTILAWGLSIPLLLVNALWLVGVAAGNVAWWVILWTALVQLMALPFAISNEALRAVTRAWNDTSGRGLFRVRAR